MKKILILISFISMMFMSCTDADGAQRILELNGYKNIQIEGYSIFGCSDDDIFKTKFIAIHGQSQQSVQGVVCSGWFKGGTIRIF